MVKPSLILLIAVLLLPAVLAIDCSKASQGICGTNGTNGTSCQYYVWVNGTCQPPTSCQTSPTVTVWSNASANCVPCLEADNGLCTASCSNYSFYYNTNLAICTTCAKQYGQRCNTCSATQCSTCETGFQLTTDKQACQNAGCNIAYCDVCDSSTACRTCDSSHLLFNGYCICNIANCQQCNSGICYSCFDGYSLEASRTSCKIDCIANCDSCSSRTTCDTCASGFKYDSSVKSCILDCTVIDNNCISCRTSTICSGCASGYRPSTSGTSCDLACDDANCASCANKTNCQRCSTGYRLNLDNVTSLYTCGLAICQIPFCLTCTSSTTCTTCANLFTPNNDKTACVPSCGVQNCAYCLTNTTCLACIDGYTTSSGSCASLCSISNCQLCATASTCKRCSDGFVLSANRRNCNFNCRISGCSVCNSATTCFLCSPGRSPSSDSTRCVVNCQDGFYFNSTQSRCVDCPTSNCRQCDSTAKCTTCLDFYYLNSDDFTCVACNTIPNCFNCDKSSATCTRCNRNFALVNNVCVSTASCTVANCQACAGGSNTICGVCNDKYALANGGASCAPIACPGNQIAMGSTCVCGQKSYLSGGSCIACSDANCLECTSTACIECVQGHYPSGTSCLPCSDPNCRQCNSLGCTRCKRRFFISGGGCQQSITARPAAVNRFNRIMNCPLGCSSCDVDNSGNKVCLEANDGYIILRGAIYQCALPCVTCAVLLSSEGTASICLSCPLGYALSHGTCVNCTDPYAASCSSNNAALSLTCQSGYTTLNSTSKTDAGVCMACADNCVKCDLTGSGNCDLGGCAPSTTQKSDGCLRCFNGCFKCASDPNTCLQCSQYYYLSNTTCLSCTAKCLSCNATTCFNCQAGTFLVGTVCVAPPSTANCVGFDVNYTKCTSCDFNYDLDNTTNTCQLSLTCNNTLTCTACPYAYFLSSGSCVTCPTLPNCSACNLLNNSICGDCNTGYYLDAGTCKVCTLTGCSACSSPLFCTTAAAGYYLTVGITKAYTGQVLPCAGNCATCVLSEITCVTCKAGSTLSGTECVSNNNQAITIVLYVKSLGKNPTVSADEQTGSVYNFIFGYYTRLGRNFGFKTHRQCQRHFRLRKIHKGSVIMDSVVDSDAVNVNVVDAVSNTQDSNFGLVSASAVSSQSSSDSNANLGLILGVSIPLGIILIIIIVLIRLSGTEAEGKMHVDQTEKEVNKDRDIEAL